MGELINGRTPEEIKDALKHCIEPVPYGCEVCPYNETCLEHAPEIDAIAGTPTGANDRPLTEQVIKTIRTVQEDK